MPHQKLPQRPLFFNGSTKTFVVISSSAVLDSRLSLAARGLLLIALSRSGDFVFDVDWIVSNSIDNRDTVVKALKELKALGYMVKRDSEPSKPNSYSFHDTPSIKFVEQSPPILQQSIDISATESKENHQRQRKGDIAQAPSQVVGKRQIALELPDWLEPYRSEMESWQLNRSKRHPKLPRGMTRLSLNGLIYAKERDVLSEFCQHAAESCWQSLGFAGHREFIDKIQQDKMGKSPKVNHSMSPIRYTLG